MEAVRWETTTATRVGLQLDGACRQPKRVVRFVTAVRSASTSQPAPESLSSAPIVCGLVKSSGVRPIADRVRPLSRLPSALELTTRALHDDATEGKAGVHPTIHYRPRAPILAVSVALLAKALHSSSP
eukprot:scaffold280196_cov30-Tisochrysis_lutea.AAC.1